MTNFITTKVTPRALKLLRMIAAITGKKQYEVLEETLAKELEQVKEEEERESHKK